MTLTEQQTQDLILASKRILKAYRKLAREVGEPVQDTPGTPVGALEALLYTLAQSTKERKRDHGES